MHSCRRHVIRWSFSVKHAYYVGVVVVKSEYIVVVIWLMLFVGSC